MDGTFRTPDLRGIYFDINHVTQVTLLSDSAFITFRDRGYKVSMNYPPNLIKLRAALAHFQADAPENKRDKPDDTDEGIEVSIVKVRRGGTLSKSPLWRCETEEGMQVNIFKHSDPLRDNYHLIVAADYAIWFDTMHMDQEDTWLEHPIRCRIAADGGAFWRLLSVAMRPGDAVPDQPEVSDENAIPFEKYDEGAEVLRKVGSFNNLEDEAAPSGGEDER